MVGVEFPPFKMSARRYARMLRLLTAARLQLASVADFTDECVGGEKKTVKGIKTFVMCVTPKGDDDDLVVDDDSSPTVNNIVASPTTVTTSAPGASGGASSSAATTPSPTTSSAPAPPSQLAATVAAVTAVFVALFATN